MSSAKSPGKRSRSFSHDDAFSDDALMGIEHWLVLSLSVELPMSPKGRRRGPQASARPSKAGGLTLREMLASPGTGAPPRTTRGRAPYGRRAPSPFSPTKRLKAMTLRSSSLNPDLQPQRSQRASNSKGILSTTSHRIQQALSLYDVYRMQGAAVTSSKHVRPLSFEEILRKEFPTAKESEYELMLEAVAERERVGESKRRVEEATWSHEERAQLSTFFAAMDVDERLISRDEFLEVANITGVEKAELGGAFDATVAGARRRSSRTPGGSRELNFEGFVKLIETLDDDALNAVRRALPFIVPPSDGACLVFDDGKQQLWRLVPGGRALVRKPSTRAAYGAPANAASLAAAKGRARKSVEGLA